MADKPLRQTAEGELSIDQVKEQLVELGKKRGALTYDEITEKLSPFDQDSDQRDEFFEYLGEQGVELQSDPDSVPSLQQVEKEA